MRLAKPVFLALGALALVSAPAAAGDWNRHGDLAVVTSVAPSYGAEYNTPFPVTPDNQRTVNQEYCGTSAEPCHQYVNTFQPYAPPVFYRVR
jgi:hypothetical protein